MLSSSFCKAKDFDKSFFRRWVNEQKENMNYHRKLWEYVMVSQALFERGMLSKGKKGLGFAVGRESLPSLFANYGCQILATDLSYENEKSKVWNDSKQLLTSLDLLNARAICDKKSFEKLVKYKAVDMNHIPKTLKNYDFTWSDCSFEHLGSIENGLNFVLNQMECLKPGGWAVHTSEYNILSNDKTLTSGDTVLFRKKDIKQLIKELKHRGHHVERMSWRLGNTKTDKFVSQPPYLILPHIRMELGGYISTSFMLIIRKGGK